MKRGGPQRRPYVPGAGIPPPEDWRQAGEENRVYQVQTVCPVSNTLEPTDVLLAAVDREAVEGLPQAQPRCLRCGRQHVVSPAAGVAVVLVEVASEDEAVLAGVVPAGAGDARWDPVNGCTHWFG